MAEPEFVLLDEAPIQARGAQLSPLKRAGRRTPRSTVLVDLHTHPRARRIAVTAAIVLTICGAAGVAVITYRKLRARRAPNAAEHIPVDIEEDLAV
jgi:hypothetical protein